MATKRPPIYPFIPRSSAALQPGQFWAIPLSDGSFGCGKVIELQSPGTVGARTSFLAAVLDWHSNQPPSFDAIARAKCLDQGHANLKVVTESGGCILGHRPLELDDIEPWEFRGAESHVNSHVHRGLQQIRPQEPEDGSLPVLSTWGYRVPVIIAEARFVQGRNRISD